jgi:transcriptional regulator NrdR family protein
VNVGVKRLPRRNGFGCPLCAAATWTYSTNTYYVDGVRRYRRCTWCGFRFRTLRRPGCRESID